VWQKPDLTGSSLTPDNFDFELYTDGSGYTDRFGGCCAVVRSLKHKKFFSCASAFYGADTARAEFEGLLGGLQGIMDAMDWNNSQGRALLRARRATVFWVSDREDLVGSVTLKADGTPEFRRKNTPDLWVRYEWYEKLFDVSACWRKRNTVAWQMMADVVASECRTMMKNYIGYSIEEGKLI